MYLSFIKITCDALRKLLPFVQFKKRFTFGKVADKSNPPPWVLCENTLCFEHLL